MTPLREDAGFFAFFAGAALVFNLT